MPLYEYRCHRCGKTFEVLQKFSDEPLEIHEQCGGEVERLLSPPALQFKGTGWYVTDYARKNGQGSSVSGNGKGEGKTEGKSEPAKSESKPPASSPSTSSSSPSEK